MLFEAVPLKNDSQEDCFAYWRLIVQVDLQSPNKAQTLSLDSVVAPL